MTKTQIRATAKRIAHDLFTNGQGHHADRLVLTVDGPPTQNLGGLAERVVSDRIADGLIADGFLSLVRED
jgi:hypothetical protein